MTASRSATDVFSAYAQDHDAPRRRLTLVVDEFYGAAVDCLRLTSGPIRRVLDLSAGTGLMGATVLAEYPDIELEQRRLLAAIHQCLRPACFAGGASA